MIFQTISLPMRTRSFLGCCAVCVVQAKIETGISGLGYLLKKKKGRSGEAIQTKTKVRSGGFQNTTYISALINKYKKQFNNIK